MKTKNVIFSDIFQIYYDPYQTNNDIRVTIHDNNHSQEEIDGKLLKNICFSIPWCSLKIKLKALKYSVT